MLFLLLVEVFHLCRQECKAAKLPERTGSSLCSPVVRRLICSPEECTQGMVSFLHSGAILAWVTETFHADRKETHITLVICRVRPNLSPWAPFLIPRVKQMFLGHVLCGFILAVPFKMKRLHPGCARFSPPTRITDCGDCLSCEYLH